MGRIRLVISTAKDGLSVSERDIDAGLRISEAVSTSGVTNVLEASFRYANGSAKVVQLSNELMGSSISAAASALGPDQPTALVLVVQHDRAPAAPSARGTSWKDKLASLFILGVKVVLAAEVGKFGLSQLRSARYLGHRYRWGPNTDSEVYSSSEEGGTSSEVAEVLGDYLSGRGTLPKDITRDEIARGLRKLDSEALEEMGVSRDVLRDVHAAADQISAGPGLEEASAKGSSSTGTASAVTSSTSTTVRPRAGTFIRPRPAARDREQAAINGTGADEK